MRLLSVCIRPRPYTVPGVPDSPRWGLTIPFTGVPLAEHEPLLRRAEAAGWDDLWSADTTGPDGFTPLALAGSILMAIGGAMRAGGTERPRKPPGVL